jgi:hypothetical protein
MGKWLGEFLSKYMKSYGTFRIVWFWRRKNGELYQWWPRRDFVRFLTSVLKHIDKKELKKCINTGVLASEYTHVG